MSAPKSTELTCVSPRRLRADTYPAPVGLKLVFLMKAQFLNVTKCFSRSVWASQVIWSHKNNGMFKLKLKLGADRRTPNLSREGREAVTPRGRWSRYP